MCTTISHVTILGSLVIKHVSVWWHRTSVRNSVSVIMNVSKLAISPLNTPICSSFFAAINQKQSVGAFYIFDWRQWKTKFQWATCNYRVCVFMNIAVKHMIHGVIAIINRNATKPCFSCTTNNYYSVKEYWRQWIIIIMSLLRDVPNLLRTMICCSKLSSATNCSITTYKNRQIKQTWRKWKRTVHAAHWLLKRLLSFRERESRECGISTSMVVLEAIRQCMCAVLFHITWCSFNLSNAFHETNYTV